MVKWEAAIITECFPHLSLPAQRASNSKMAGDGDVEEAMETEILPSTSNGDAKIKERDGKSTNLPWYVLFLSQNFISVLWSSRYEV